MVNSGAARFGGPIASTATSDRSMKHIFVCREYPPSPSPPGGIGSYVTHIARLLALRGETVHVIAQRWEGAPARMSQSLGGNLVVHRVGIDDPIRTGDPQDLEIARALAKSDCPGAAFSWRVAHLAEHLSTLEEIDLIEAPEWEAPLYYFQLRRQLGLGPRRQPPCIIHLHSPSELIFAHNEWDLTLSDYQPLRRMEEFTIKSADSLLCASRYLGGQAEQLYNLPSNRISVIPYPAGDTPHIERVPDTWRHDLICYVGRLELRKGIVEWVDAAIEVAAAHPSAEFEFFGSDTSLTGDAGQSVRECL